MLATMVQIDGYDPVANGPITLRAASHDDPRICHLDGQTWWPALSKLPTLRYDLFDGAFAGQIVSPSSSLTMQTEPWEFFSRYILADSRLRLWTGNLGDAWGAFTLRFDGRIASQPQTSDGVAAVDFAVDDRWLDGALLTTYAGTTGIEGPAAMKGQAKPLALGAPRYVAGKLIDVVNNVFQLSAYGAIQGVEASLERLARFGASLGDYASYAALVAASIPAGRWATCEASGLVRLGAPPAGQISFLVQGDKAGTDGWARKPGQVIRRLAILAGGTGKIDDMSLNALDTARPYNISVYLDEQTTARDLIQRLAASVNAVAGVSWTGQLFVAPVGITADGPTLAADGSSLPPVSTVKQIDIAAPFKKLSLGAERAWTVHPLADIAFTATLIDAGAYVSGNTYREGNIVQDQGTSWLYINPAPTSGNAPSALPTLSNAWWKALVVPTSTNVVQGSVNGTTGWHSPPEEGDLYLRFSTDGGASFGDPVAVSGEAGPGQYQQFVFKRSATQPATPTGDGIPSGWSDGVPGGTGLIWMSVATQVGGVTDGSWSTPRQISGDPGATGAPGADGAPGIAGVDGAPGTTGPAGATLYAWTAYSDAPDGTANFTTGAPGGRGYQGVANNKTTATESTNPTDYEWSKYTGPALFGLVPNAYVVVGSDYILKTSNGTGWNGSAYSSEGYQGGAQMSFTLGSSGSDDYVIGLNTDPTTNASYETIDYAWRPNNGSGQIDIIESGTTVYTGIAQAAGDRFQIVYNGRTITYYRGGTVVRQITASAGQTFYLDSSIYQVGQRISKLTFGSAGIAGTDGPTGPAGYSTAIVQLWKRSSTGVPSGPSNSTTYTFASSSLTDPGNGWSTTIPGGTDPLYATAATAVATGTTDTIGTGEWATASLASASGVNVATVYLYQRSATLPSLPSATVTYTFGTPPTITGVNNGWQTTIPTSGTNPIFITQATAASAGSSDTIASGEWAAAAILAQNGATGPAGLQGPAGIGTIGMVMVGAVTFDGTNFYCGSNASDYTTNGAYSQQTIAGACSLTFQAPDLYGGGEEHFFGLSQAPSSSINFTIDRCWRHIAATYASGSYLAEVWEGGALRYSEGWNGSFLYNVRYDGQDVIYSRTDTSGNVTIVWSTHVGSGKAFGLMLSVGHLASIGKLSFGAAGSDANSAPPVTPIYSPGSYNAPFSVSVANGASVTVESGIFATYVSGGGAATVSMQNRYSLNNGSSYTAFGPTGSTSVVSGDPAPEVAATAIYTNASGATQVILFGTTLTKTGGPTVQYSGGYTQVS